VEDQSSQAEPAPVRANHVIVTTAPLSYIRPLDSYGVCGHWRYRSNS
jgi:hypothetical protein